MYPTDGPAYGPPAERERRLAALWFADIVGFTTIAGRDEVAAMDLIAALHAAAEEQVTRCRGRLVKTIGDAVLAEFTTTESALRAALSLSMIFSAGELRIGVHTGEVVRSPDGDVYGDGVNTTARLVREAEPGEIVVSEDVWRQLRNRPAEFSFEYVGKKQLRGIDYPIALYRARAPDTAASAGDGAADAALTRAGRPRGALVPSFDAIARRVRAGMTRPEVRRAAAICLAFVFPVASLLAWKLRTPEAAAFPSRGWALLAEFENDTPIDGLGPALTTAMSVAVEQSAFVNVVAGQQVEDALRRMRRDPDLPVDRSTARELAIREGLDVVLLPSVAAIGSQYFISLRIEEPGSGRQLRTLSVRVNSSDELLDGLDELALDLRAFLGESGDSIARRSQPLEAATTSSLEALQQYSLGFEAQRRGRYREAKRYFTAAVALDSTFSRALASLGMLEWEKGLEYQSGAVEFEGFDSERGKALLRRAVAHLDSVTERERLGTLAVFSFAVEGDLQQAIEYYRLRVARYPDDFVSHNNLGRLYYYAGRYEESVAAYKEVVRIQPGLTGAYDGIVGTYLYLLGQPDSGLAWARREVVADSSYFRAFDLLGFAYVGTDSIQEAAVAFAKAIALNPDYVSSRFRLGHTQRLLAEYPKAIATFEEILARDTANTNALHDLGVTFGFAGNQEQMHRYLTRWRETAGARLLATQTPDAAFKVATVATRLGDRSLAEQEDRRGLALLTKGAVGNRGRLDERKWLGVDSLGYFELAALRSVEGRQDEAVAALEAATQHGLTNSIWVLLHPDFNDLRTDKRFRRLIDEALHRREK